jgi:exodeoxyribonuclease VII large subunit
MNLTSTFDNYKRGLLHLMRALQGRCPARELMIRHNRFADLRRRLVGSSTRSLESARHRCERIEGMLRVRGPDATLRRGYSITTNERGKIIRRISAARPKTKTRTRVSDGEFGSEIQ